LTWVLVKLDVVFLTFPPDLNVFFCSMVSYLLEVTFLYSLSWKAVSKHRLHSWSTSQNVWWNHQSRIFR